MTHQILSNVEGLNCSNQFIWDVEAIYFDVDQAGGLELGTEYSCVSYADYWAYRANGARWEIGRINLPPSGVWRLYRLFRSNPGTGAWSYKIEGNVVYTIAGYYTTGVALTTGLVANQNTAVMSYHRNLGLEKKRWDGAWEAWAGQDGMWVDNPPMCGNWVSATEWREGEKVC